MNFYYISSTCSKKKYKEIIENKGLRNQQQSQKYNYLLAHGLYNNECNVQMISIRPINRNTDKKRVFKMEKETEAGIQFQYIPFLNIPVLRNVSVFIGVVQSLIKQKEKKSIYLCDALNIAGAAATRIVSKLKRTTCIAIVTDVPCHRPHGGKPRLYEKINLWLMRKFDAYLLLTKEMNNLVNPSGKPFIVLEGHSDVDMNDYNIDVQEKYEKKVCLYAGSTRKIYGIDQLVDGFLKADVKDSELHIYGSGDFDNNLKELEKKNPEKIKFFGVVPNDIVVKEEMKAWLLINPRPTKEDYVRYSFPSKNMEYMASGTPVLTTKLPGMPDEYDKYVYIITKEDSQGICEAIKKVFQKDMNELLNKGSSAKHFILSQKNNIVQARKLLDFSMHLQ